MDIKHIGNNIYKLRLTRGLTQESLGRQIGLTASAISNIEKEKFDLIMLDMHICFEEKDDEQAGEKL